MKDVRPQRVRIGRHWRSVYRCRRNHRHRTVEAAEKCNRRGDA